MQRMLLSFLLLCGVIIVQSTPIGYFSQEFFDSGNANTFIDQVLTAVKAKYGKDLDPFHVPDKTLSFQKKIGLITIKGNAKLSEGTIVGLSHLHRSGNSTLGSENNHFVAHLRIGDDNIRIHYKVEANFMNLLHPHLTLESEVGNIDIQTTIKLDDNNKAVLSEFHIEELKHVKVHVHGLGILDPLIDLIADEFVAIFNPTARDVLSHIMQNLVGDMLKDFKLGGTY